MFQSKDLFKFNESPIENFNRLFEEAKKNPGMDPTIMTLATTDKCGKPNGRIVLLKQVDQNDFIFFTNYNSPKGHELEFNPEACLVFFWGPLAVQIRILGSVKKVTRQESETYFKTRPRLSQIGAWASKQSEIIDSYETLQLKIDSLAEEFKDKEIPCPEFWGGYRLKAQLIEFWFGMEGRLHYRYVYESSGSNDWLRTMKSP